jgi:hypothetical protein
MWPSDDFAGASCEVVDLDGDGIKEFAIWTKSSARVVSYRNAKFSYRDRMRNGGDEPTLGNGSGDA